jgi:N-carbamoylputrescine amidase
LVHDRDAQEDRVRVLCFDLDAERGDLAAQWRTLVEATAQEEPQLVVLPEMPFAPWLAASPSADPAAWASAVAAHDDWLARFPELGTQLVVTTRPVIDDDAIRGNEALAWQADAGVVATRRKTFLPDEPGFYEASWYERGPVDFSVVTTPLVRLGMMVCTELWFPEHGRVLGQQGAQIIVVPRATPASSVERWEAGARVLATISGAFCLSVNRSGGHGAATFAGGSVIVDPEGDVLARTTPDHPMAVADLDLELATRARATYPRYVDASPR